MMRTRRASENEVGTVQRPRQQTKILGDDKVMIKEC